MGVKTGIGKTGIFMSIAIALAMCVTTYILKPVKMSRGDYGICLPSPHLWAIPDFLSWLINLIIIGGIAFILFQTNRHFNFIRTTEPALPVIFVIATCSSPWFTQGLDTSTLLCLVNVISLAIVFGVYNRPNATQQIFSMGGLIGLGSMFEYAFLPMAFVYIIWALILKILRFKETIAFLLGIMCPYWIGLGLGLISISDFHIQSLTPFFGSETDYSEIWLLLCGTGIAAIGGLFATMFNSMKLYAGNSIVNSMNLCVTVMGLAALICIFADYENMTAYVVTLYVAMSVQLANICALWNPEQEWLVSAIPSVIYIGLFLAAIFL